ncbi:hypothetical protein LTR64_006919 [Lithohypha guttulata]|uniref:Major facilitator superfamily (MFS) profile domain-containing protein n=1 Tax=Lithohypha guttulata TaxID=1690604 RepID=A0AAN7T903_9EURO|nr:hypothetical protein LTR51_004524 [Lithohypha guttulata]KAK5091131.1 hypothetical protein LTR05_001311 [Lithohypha guttulata]
MGQSHIGIDYSTINPSQKWRILTHQKRYGLWAFWTSIGSMILGYDYVIGGQLASLPEFQRKFGYEQANGDWIIPARYLSAWAAIGPACDIIAAAIAAPLLEKYGRKPQILFAAVVSTVGVLLQQLASDWKMVLAGRGVNGIAIGILFTISPLWIGETCRPELRGFWLCFFNTSIVVGQFMIVAVTRGTSELTNRWQWEAAVCSMYIWPFLLVVVYPFFPESAYWLVREGKIDQARKSLRRMYGSGFDESFYDIEIRRFEDDIRTCAQLNEGLKPYKLFGLISLPEAEAFKKQHRKRTFTAIFAASGQQMIGATFVIGFATYFFDLINIQNFFTASIILYVVMLLATIAVFPLSEMVGRRTLIVPGQFILCFFLLLIGIMGCIPNQTKAGWAIVVFTYLWAIIYQMTIGATGFVLASEVATLRLRAVTQALVTMTNGVWGLIMQFTVPYMINPDAGHLGGKTGFIFFGMGMIAAVGGYFLYPETKGLSFEILDELYAAGVKPKHFKREGMKLQAQEVHSVEEIHEATPQKAG